MPLKTKRWDDPVEPDDGLRVLVCRYRPRGVRKEDETWDVWTPNLGPSRELHAAFYGKSGAPITWDEYERRYLEEIKSAGVFIRSLADRLRRGERLTLLCSSACVDPARCHRTLLGAIVERESA
ncbi:DUF488 domain-containing protein [Polyangium aurulentum]|uniref:DUF488 domain-containing protein n=1 Tax=Polyangium aurulentum TaxID=2567896 RepID=UPI0010ADBB82|nr:DUF488 family protein [Polyangium aurulentum]UQA60319.1 DUF488 family protein [Polyangium aurulentum]